MCQPSVQTCLNTTTIQIWQPLLGLSQPNFGEPLSMQTLSLSQPDSADYLGKVADYKASNTELKLKCAMLLRATVLSPKSILWCSHCWFVSSEMLFKTKSEKSVISSSGWKQTAADWCWFRTPLPSWKPDGLSKHQWWSGGGFAQCFYESANTTAIIAYPYHTHIYIYTHTVDQTKLDREITQRYTKIDCQTSWDNAVGKSGAHTHTGSLSNRINIHMCCNFLNIDIHTFIYTNTAGRGSQCSLTTSSQCV